VDQALDVLIVTAKGYGKRTPVSDYRMQTRGGKGIKTINVTDKNGAVVSLKMVKTEEDLMIITSSGTLIRMSMEGISTMGRYTQGVKLIHIRDEDAVATVSRIDKNEEEPEDEELLEGAEAANSEGPESTLDEGSVSDAEAEGDDSGSEA
ncbi:TPA: DNA gyrase subunit A, partial [Streptococcus pyogenes]|nr:DNA gyrase subunit A [Streptococcus pyogenes]